MWGTILNDWGVDVNFLISVEWCCPEEEAVTIEDIHDSLYAWNDGRTLCVTGWHTSNNERKLVSDIWSYLSNIEMPPKSVLHLVGDTLPTLFTNSQVDLIGQIDSYHIDPYCHPSDSFVIYFNVTDCDSVRGGVFGPPPRPQRPGRRHDLPTMGSGERDPCRFAILISGGIEEDQNFVRYRNLMSDYYSYLIGEGYESNNIYVIYFDGVTNLPAGIPAGRIESATIAHIDDAVNGIVASMGGCAGESISLFLWSFDHGSDNGNICLLGRDGLGNAIGISPVQVRNRVQTLLDGMPNCPAGDPGCHDLYVVMGQCFGGRPSLELKFVDSRSRTRMLVTSNANWNVVTVSDGAGDPFLEEILRQLDVVNESFEVAMVEACELYYDFLDAELVYYSAHPYDPLWKWQQHIIDLQACIAALSIVWKRDHLEGYGDPCDLVGFPGGKFNFLFEADNPICANTALQELKPSGYQAVDYWAYNIPGHRYYTAGNEFRTWCIDATSIGVFKAVSDCRDLYTMTVSSITDRAHDWKLDDCISSPCNIEDYAGFFVGWTDGLPDEFGDMVTPYHTINDVNLVGFELSEMPQVLGPSGVTTLEASFSLLEYNVLWIGMELMLVVSEVMTPGTLVITLPNLGRSEVELYIDHEGTYTVPIGTMSDDSTQTITFDATGACFAVDAWGLNTVMEDGGGVPCVFDPDPAYIYYKYAFTPMHATVSVGGFEPPYTAEDVVFARVNGIDATIVGVSGDVVELDIPIAGFLDMYGAPLDTVPRTFEATGEFSDGQYWGSVAQIDMIGKSSASGGKHWILPPDEIVLHGDVDASGFVDIDDVVTIISVIFQGGSFFGPFLIADCDCSHSVDIDDVVYVIDYIFLDGPFPCHP
jgi:hypothetical protein